MMATGRTTTWSCLRRSNTVVLWWLTVVVAAVGTVSASVKEYYWEMEYMFAKPDCKESIVMAINGTFPGPTITATVGDTVIVHVVNKLHTEGVVIHWHGIRQIGTPWADGAAGVTQCAINPGESFSYKFIVDKAGTYFYHGHYGMQRSGGLYGWLIVNAEKEPFPYDGELYMLLSDWWHESTHFQQVRLSSKPFHWIGEPQSILINGKGQFNCSLAAQFSDGLKNECSFGVDDGQCNPPATLVVKPNKKYRLRIASTTSLSSLNLAIQGHKLEVVEADGNYITPFLTDDIDIYSGETYSVILRTDQHPGENYWISVGVRGRKPETPPALAFLRYFIAPHNGFPKSPPPETPQWNDFNRSKAFTKGIFARDGSPPPPEKSLHRLFLLNTQNLINGFTKWAINNVSLVVPTTPYLGSIKYGLREAYDHREPPRNFPADYDINKPTANQSSVHGNGIYVFEYNVTVDVILQNAEALKAGKSEIHPWHLHGHDFWVLGYGEGKFRPGVDEAAFNLKNPPLRNTAVLYPYGWTALRYVTDNPGVWFFHCHIEPHLHMGMGVVFAEGINRLGDIPDDALGCGMTRTIFVNRHR